MKIALFVFFVLILLSFIPIPIKTKLILNNDEASIYVFWKRIKIKNEDRQTKKAKIIEHKLIHKPPMFNNGNVIYTLRNNRYKPRLKVNVDFEFGFHDAAVTGLFYGFISALYPVIYQLLLQFIEIPSYSFKLTPDFENVTFKLNVECIISLNLAKIIYMFYMLYRNYNMARKLEASQSTSI